MLRPAACHHIYKEYLSGIAVLSVIYTNYLVLFPKLYVEARILKYILYTACSVLLAFLFEMALVAPDITAYMSVQFPSHKILSYLIMDGFFVLLRDVSVVTVTFSVQAFLYYMNLSQNKDHVMLKEFHRIEARSFDKSNKKILVLLEDISYCKQERNYTRIYLADGQSLLRYGTFKNFTELLNESYAVQVSRSVVVPYSNVVSYNSTGVLVKSNPENTIISYTDNLSAHAYDIFSKNVQKSENRSVPTHTTKKRIAKPKTTRPQKTQQQDILYSFIAEHPGCSAAEIKKNRSASQSTVNRILAQLKKDGLIEYVGSKKTGGYHVKKETRQDSAGGDAL